MQRRQLKDNETLQSYLQDAKEEFFTKLTDLINKEHNAPELLRYLDRVTLHADVTTDTEYQIQHDTDLKNYTPEPRRLLIGNEVRVNGVGMGRKDSRVHSTLYALQAIADIRNNTVIKSRSQKYRMRFKYRGEVPTLHNELLGVELYFPEVYISSEVDWMQCSVENQGSYKGDIQTHEAQQDGQITVTNRGNNKTQTVSMKDLKFLW